MNPRTAFFVTLDMERDGSAADVAVLNHGSSSLWIDVELEHFEAPGTLDRGEVVHPAA